MRKVKIVCDSTADLSLEDYKALDVEVIPLIVRFNEDTFKDLYEIKCTEIYKMEEKYKGLPKTSSVPPAVIEEVYQKYIDEDYDIIFVCVSSLMSGAMNNAVLASKSFEEGRIFVFDSMNLSTGTALCILKMCKLRDEGKSAKEIVDEVKAIVPNIRSQFAVDTLEYLHKGGRCSGTAKLFGKIFHVHPVIQVVDGKMIVASKPRGKMKAALNEMLETFKSDVDRLDHDCVMVTHSLIGREAPDYLISEMSKYVDPKIIKETDAGCVISAHCGPGTIGILYIVK